MGYSWIKLWKVTDGNKGNKNKKKIVYLFVWTWGDGEDEGWDESTRMASVGLVSNERKELVEMEIDDEVGLKDCCSHWDASVSGQGELMKMSNNGTQDSIFSLKTQGVQKGVFTLKKGAGMDSKF